MLILVANGPHEGTVLAAVPDSELAVRLDDDSYYVTDRIRDTDRGEARLAVHLADRY